MKIQHVRPFFTGLLCWVLAAGVVLLSLVQGASLRHLIGAAILAALGAVELWFAFSHKSIEEEMGVKADERALFIATKSGHMTLRILNGKCVDLKPLITDVLPMSQWLSGYEKFRKGKAMKVVLHPWDD